MFDDNRPFDDEQRLAALQSYHILDTLAEKDFDDIAELAAAICNTPVSLITFIDRDRQWFKSHKGTEISETDISLALCTHTIASAADLMEVEDTRLDVRFANNPLVTGETQLTFYAGVPLVNPDGFALGTLCVIDHQPHKLTEAQRSALKTLARQVMTQLELRRQNTALQAVNQQYEKLVLQQLDSEQHTQKLHIDLQGNEMRLRAFIHQAPVSICIIRARDLMVTEVNDRYLELVGKKRGQLLNQLIWDGVPEAAKFFAPLMQQVIDTGIPFVANEMELELIRNGIPEKIFVNFVYEPIRELDGFVSYIMVVGTEVTDQVKLAIDGERVSQQLRLAVEAARIGSWHIDPDTKALEYSPMLASIFGYVGTTPMSYEQAINQVIESDRERILAEIDTAIEKGGHYEITYAQRRFDNDHVIWLHSIGKIRQDHQGNYSIFSGVVMDVTEQVAAKAMLEETEAKLLLAIDTAKIGIWSFDRNTQNFHVNQCFQEMLGFEREDEITLVRLLGLLDEGYKQKGINALEALNRQEAADLEAFITNKVTQKKHWVRAVSKGEADLIYSNRVSGILLDLTEQKEMVQQKDDFISIASHELKTPLTSLRAYIQLLEQTIKNPYSPLIPKLVGQAARSAEKLINMVQQLLDATRLAEGQVDVNRTTFNLTSILYECVDQIGLERSKLFVVEGEKNIEVYADEQRVEQVVVNFMNNALKYAANSSKIVLKAVRIDGAVKVSVCDEGPGIIAEKLPHLFERYYRSDHSGKQYSGLGLGLYLSAETIRKHGGEIGVESEVGKGSTFWFTLPIQNK